MKQKKLLYIFLILFLESEVFPQEGSYISPSIQIGMDSIKKSFWSNTSHISLFTKSLISMDFIHTAGLAISFKKIRIANELKNDSA
ncbi:MAG: hypothetical protein CMF99_06295 [Candidatus Marinimicrobia bacterium]|nr:hypothetical protein [Candidatus Neomarinimicrobiota bacterium]|tara:strand:- start:248 stop:505 length:258 start_codon:yes stop_codon:yes gene_type:complete